MQAVTHTNPNTHAHKHKLEGDVVKNREQVSKKVAINKGQNKD